MNYTNGDALEPSVFHGANNSMWMVFGSSKFSDREGQKGLWIVQLDPKQGMLYNSSTPAKHTPGNHSVVPTPLHLGRANATISSPTVFRLIRPKLWYETNLSAWDRKFTNDTTHFVQQTEQQDYYFLVYSEKYYESDAYWIEPDEEEDNYWWMKKWVPKPMSNWTHTLRVVRARTPHGPWYDADGNKLGHVGAGSLIFNSTLAKKIRKTDIDSFEFAFEFRISGGWKKWNRHNGPSRKSSMGYAPFCGCRDPGIQEYWRDGANEPNYVLSFTYYECGDPYEIPWFGQLELKWGNNETQYSDPWPEVLGTWDPYTLHSKVEEEFPWLLVLGITAIAVGTFVVGWFINYEWNHFKKSKVHHATVILRDRPWYTMFTDPFVMITNEFCYRCCGHVCCNTMDKTDALIEKYSDSLGDVVKAFDTYMIDNTQRLLWLQKWNDMDKDGNNGLDAAEFREFFKMSDNMWSQRSFEFFNSDFNGAIPLRDFLRVSYTMLVFDRPMAYEFAFRLISRRGAGAFDPAFACIDKQDIFEFLATRYPRESHSSLHKKAMQIFLHIDDDGSGGITYQEFQRFCRENYTFLLWGHRYQTMLRTKLFSEDYWRTQTQSRQDIYIYDRMFFEDLDLKLKQDHPPFNFAIDFPGVHTEVVQVKAEALDKKKNLITQTNVQTALGFKKMKNAVMLLGQLGETRLTMRYGFYRWKTATEKIRKEKGENARVSVFYGGGTMVEMDGGGEGEDKTSALLEASKYEVHARIIDDQKRHRRTPDEVVSTYCGFVENKLQAPTHLQPRGIDKVNTANLDATSWGAGSVIMADGTSITSLDELPAAPEVVGRDEARRGGVLTHTAGGQFGLPQLTVWKEKEIAKTGTPKGRQKARDQAARRRGVAKIKPIH
mmetsp:Transcript_57574/g.158463  ORF Transcript_57574/g.158463 Transcript_57574/m.158463 type:complete len:886 (+) Transcript_57574:177-2834(+)